MGIKYCIFNEEVNVSVASICGLMVFPVIDPRYGPSHSVTV